MLTILFALTIGLHLFLWFLLNQLNAVSSLWAQYIEIELLDNFSTDVDMRKRGRGAFEEKGTFVDGVNV